MQIYDNINIQSIIVSYVFGFFACTTLWSCNIVSEKLLPFMFESFDFDILPAMKARFVNIKLQFLRNYFYLNIYLSLLLHWLISLPNNYDQLHQSSHLTIVECGLSYVGSDEMNVLWKTPRPL